MADGPFRPLEGQPMATKQIETFESVRANPDIPQVKDIAAEELAKKMGQVHLVDVRQPDEFIGELGHIPGAKLVVLNTLPEHINELPKNETIVFICRSGGRSARATAFALDQGFEHVFNLKGGMLNWNALNLQTEGKN
jgi:hydroxyacylglutathione hydrolase